MSSFLYIAGYRDRFGGETPSHKKIGITNDPPARMRSVSDTKGTIDVVVMVLWQRKDRTTMQPTELMIHTALAERRLNGEWFRDDDGSLIDIVSEILVSEPIIEQVNVEAIPPALPKKAGNRTGHFDYVSQPKGRSRSVTPEEVIGQLQAAYEFLRTRLPEEYVALNDNGPYIRANQQGISFWLEPRSKGVKLNFWAGPLTPLDQTIDRLLKVPFDGRVESKMGRGKHENLRQFCLYDLSIDDLGLLLDNLK